MPCLGTQYSDYSDRGNVLRRKTLHVRILLTEVQSPGERRNTDSSRKNLTINDYKARYQYSGVIVKPHTTTPRRTGFK